MPEIKVSVIVPVYKVQDYVAKAIESIQAQTLTEWEMFLVDDGSPDKSGEVCDPVSYTHLTLPTILRV